MKLTAPGASDLNKDGAKITKRSQKGSPSELGAIAGTIGTGDDAKNSIIWVTIRWSFIIGGLLSLAIYFRPVYCKNDYSGNLIDDIKAAWSIFMPVITLALGYIFGKNK